MQGIHYIYQTHEKEQHKKWYVGTYEPKAGVCLFLKNIIHVKLPASSLQVVYMKKEEIA